MGRDERFGHFNDDCVFEGLYFFDYSSFEVAVEVGLFVAWLFDGFFIESHELYECIFTPNNL